MDKIIISIIGVLFMGFVAWFFFGGNKEDMSKMSAEDMDHMNH